MTLKFRKHFKNPPHGYQLGNKSNLQMPKINNLNDCRTKIPKNEAMKPETKNTREKKKVQQFPRR